MEKAPFGTFSIVFFLTLFYFVSLSLVSFN